ncbi:hypothetical protein MKW94_002362, partial [Papaver nudicaule]|nr:hypothetical protein [Papaver nudicaule]
KMGPLIRRLGAKIISSRNFSPTKSTRNFSTKATEVGDCSICYKVVSYSVIGVLGVAFAGWVQSKKIGKPVKTILGFTVGKNA